MLLYLFECQWFEIDFCVEWLRDKKKDEDNIQQSRQGGQDDDQVLPPGHHLHPSPQRRGEDQGGGKPSCDQAVAQTPARLICDIWYIGKRHTEDDGENTTEGQCHKIYCRIRLNR